MNEFEVSGFDEGLEDGYEAVTMIDDDGNELEYLVIDSLEADGKTYHLMIESSDADSETAEAVIFKEVAQDDESFIYEAIDDDEFDKIAAMFENDNDDYTLEV